MPFVGPNNSRRDSALTSAKNLAMEGSNSVTPSTNYCCQEDERSARRYNVAKSSILRHGDARSDHQLYKLSEAKTSDEEESLTELDVDENGREDVHPTYRKYDSGSKKFEKPTREHPNHGYENALGSHRAGKYENVEDEDRLELERGENIAPISIPPSSQRKMRNCVNTVNLPQQALIAMKKLEQLKDLQRRRDFAERFYTQEIRRLIGENFFNDNFTCENPPQKTKERVGSPGGNRGNADGVTSAENWPRSNDFVKELEPYGTMTTITRLDCGCVKELTRPIFNSSIGHVQKCDDHRYENRVTQKLTSLNPQELAYRSPATRPLSKSGNDVSSPSIKTKPKCSADPETYQRPLVSASRDLESWQDRRKLLSKPRMKRSPGSFSPVRNTSPVRKYSDTSSNSPREFP